MWGPSINFAPQWVHVWLAYVTRGMLGRGLRALFSWADKQIEPQMQLELLSASYIDKSLSMKGSVITARHG